MLGQFLEGKMLVLQSEDLFFFLFFFFFFHRVFSEGKQHQLAVAEYIKLWTICRLRLHLPTEASFAD